MLKTARQDRQGVRQASDLEQKYNFNKSFAEIMGIATDAQKTAEEANETATDTSEKMTHEEIFNLLTKDGELKGLYRGDDGELYINASYIQTGEFLADLIKAGVIKSKDGESVVIDLENGLVNLTGNVKTQSETKNGYVYQSEVRPTGIGSVLWDHNSGDAAVYSTTLNGEGLEIASDDGAISLLLHPNEAEINPGAHLQLNNFKNLVMATANDDEASLDLYDIFDDRSLRAFVNSERIAITGLTAPVESSDAVNKAYVDGNTMPQMCAYINTAVSADTITAPFVLLNISANNTELRTLLGGANYAYLQTQYYHSVNGWRLQVAWSYAINPARMAFRTEYNGVWSNWGSVSSEVEQTTTGVLKHAVGNVTYDYPFTYRIIKKANGIVEIYGTSDEIETHITKAWGSLVESGSFSFPIYGITLTSVLFCNTSFISSAGSSMAWTEGCGNGVTSPGATYLCRADSVQSIKGKLCSYTVGTWK